MMRSALSSTLLFICIFSHAQNSLKDLTVEKIMRDPKWIGTSPSSPQWSYDSKYLFFSWNPTQSLADSTYYISLTDRTPRKASPAFLQENLVGSSIVYNKNRSAYAYIKDNDVFFVDVKSNRTKAVTKTTDVESNVSFSFNDSRIVYVRSQNMYAWDIATGETMQLTNFRASDAIASAAGRTGSESGNRTGANQQEQWLKNDQLRNFEVLRDRKEKKDSADAYNRSIPKPKELKAISIEDKNIQGQTISPDGRFISYRLFKAIPASNAKTTIVPSYVTESGFTTDLPARTKVGAQQGQSEFYVYDRLRDTVYTLLSDSIPGIRDLPAYLKDYPSLKAEKEKKPLNRPVTVIGPYWSPNGTYAILDIRSQDNKDRWLMRWNKETGGLQLVDRQHDEAWIGGPGIGFGRVGWMDDENFWFQSEATGYSHLYVANLSTGKKRALTSGNYEVQQAQLSKDNKTFFIVTNEVHPGEQHFYHLLNDGSRIKFTSRIGAHQVTVSPDQKHIAVLHSYSTRPWELFVGENKWNAPMEQVTHLATTEEFRSYPWRDPKVTSFTARDGQQVYARIYEPSEPHPSKPAVIFVHGAGYLQNAHKWWSSYFREYMFNNLLAAKGYYVMDIDFRASSGYGRDWRTGIYRHMGGKDLTDNIDAAEYLVKNFGVDPKRIGVYGGSYGGFITLMGMFTTPDVFAAGAALRPVTDWANYNHGYTSNILNEPYNDSIAYHNSSPYYYAEGLKGHLLICHGMIDVNVHFQDAVKLAQRLIELGKDNWELAGYPLEDHAFVEPSSWTDEYKRVLRLFETVLKK